MSERDDAIRYGLLPCPFCGGKPYFDMDDSGWHWVECGQCHVATNQRASAMEDCKPLLAETWNSRALDKLAVEQCEDARELVDEIQAIKWLIDEGPAHVKLTEAQTRLTKLKDIITARDERIRAEALREAADRAQQWFYDTIASAELIELERAWIPMRMRQITTLRSAILAPRGAHDDGHR